MARTFIAASSESLSLATCPISAFPFTYSFWFNPPTDDGVNDWMFYLGNDDDKTMVGPNWATAGNPIRHVGESASGNFNSSNGVNAAAWNSLSYTQTDDTNQSLWLNGTNTTNGNADSGIDPSTWNKISFGAVLRASALFYDGSIALVAVWDVALSAADHAGLHDGYHPYLIQPESLVFFAPCGGLDGANDQDIDLISGTALTVGGTPTTADHPPGLIYPSRPQLIIPAAAITAAITGTATATIDETDVVAGGKTIITTLTGDTWVTA